MKRINLIYGQPLRSDGEIAKFQSLLGGQPYLVRRGLNEFVARSLTMGELEAIADTEEGPFSDHLKRFLVLITRTPAVLEAVQLALAGRPITDETLFNRLRAAGLMRGACSAQGRFRCELYRKYLHRHLAHESR